MNEPNSIKRFFNKASNTYDDNTHLQQAIGEKLITLIQQQTLLNPSIIDLGCGTGAVTRRLAIEIPHRHFHAIDIADQLLNIASERLSSFDIRVYEADFNHLTISDHRYDIAFSNMALQWSTDLSKTIQSITTLLSHQGLLAFSLPLFGTLHELKHQYSLNHFLPAPLIKNKLTDSGLELIYHHTETRVLTFDNLYLALKSIKNMGANYTGKRINKGLRGKSFLSLRMLQQLSYHIGYFIARKPAS
jgi:malonyl-CoA O-methyltransferase